MNLTDTLTLDAPRRTADGYMAATVRAARTGIQLYSGAEVGKPELATVRVYRPEAEVFHKDSLRTLAHRPVTIDHPPVAVNADNWRDYAVGLTGDEIARDGEFVRVPLAIMDASAIQAVTGGKNQLSCGYACDLDFTAGEFNGQTYDAVQSNIRFNHIAAVGVARGGPSLRIGDSNTMATRTISFDGISIEVTDQAAQAIEKLQGQVAKLTTDATSAKAAHDVALADRDAKLAKAEAERDAALGKQMTDAQLDARVSARADLISTAKAIHDADYSGKPDAEIRRMAVTGAGVNVADKSPEYIAARFDILADEAKAHGRVNDAIRTNSNGGGAITQQHVFDAARKSAEGQNAWRNKQ